MSLVRLQIEVDEHLMAELDRLGKLGGLRTRKDLMNNAFTLLKWAVRQRVEGHAIASVNEREGVYKELEMPFLDHVSTSTQEQRNNGAGHSSVSRAGRSAVPLKQVRHR
jgi:hypothetical protein